MGRVPPAIPRQPLSQGEESFAIGWRALGLVPAPVREYRFHEVREWRFDFAWPDAKVAVEIEGGVEPGMRGRHVSARGFRADAEKYNAAAFHGWRVFRLTKDMISTEFLRRLAAEVAEQNG